LTVRTTENARWDCHACGACCRLYELGPVEPAIIDGLVARDVASAWAPAADAPWFQTRKAPDGSDAYFLTHRDGHCVFLEADNRCAVHRLYGADAKPSFCREFPFHLVEDPKGTVAVVRPTCAGWHQSHRDGRPIADQVAEVVALPRATPVRRFAPTAVGVLPDVAVSLDDWMYLESALLADIAEPDEPATIHRALRTRMFQTLRRTPPTPTPARADEAARALFGLLTDLLAPAIADTKADPHRLAFARAAHCLVSDARSRRTTPPAPDTSGYLHLILRSAILGKSFANLGGLSTALGAHLLLIRALPSAALQDNHEAITTWHKLLDNPATVATLRRAKPALDSIFLHTA
jgi:Fe-S-cluster containining protein